MVSTSAAATLTVTEMARRSQIVAGAIAAVGELGYHGASLAEIAKRAGVAKSALLYYFGSRDALLMHVVEAVFGALDEATAHAVAAETSPEAQLRAYIDAYIGFADENRAGIAAGTEIVVAHRTPDGTPLYLTEDEDETATLATVISAGMRAGVFRQMPVATAVSIVQAILEQPIFEVQKNPLVDLTDLGAAIAEFVFRGLRA